MPQKYNIVYYGMLLNTVVVIYFIKRNKREQEEQEEGTARGPYRGEGGQHELLYGREGGL